MKIINNIWSAVILCKELFFLPQCSCPWLCYRFIPKCMVYIFSKPRQTKRLVLELPFDKKTEAQGIFGALLIFGESVNSRLWSWGIFPADAKYLWRLCQECSYLPASGTIPSVFLMPLRVCLWFRFILASSKAVWAY